MVEPESPDTHFGANGESRMTAHFRKGDRVSWNWSGSKAEGKVAERFERRVKRTIKGTAVTRNGSKEEPAYLIVQDDGDKVLKSASELSED